MANGLRRAMSSSTTSRRPARGFTLIELIIVIVIGAVIATTLSLFLPPALQSFRDTRVRSELVDQADTSMRRMLRDVRMAVPNSLRMPNSACFEVVPASAGGRYRMDIDVVNDSGSGCAPSATCSAPLNTNQPITQFDSLSTLSTTPAVGDWVVIDNQNGNDVYEGTNRAAISAISTPAATQGKHRITIASTQFPAGYDGGRFMIVPNSQRAVFYVCSGADGTVDANGNGKGTLYRIKNYGFNATYPASCASVSQSSPASSDVLATNIKSCTFVYDANHGATQQSGFLWLEMAITRNNETTYLAQGAHVMNAP
jgi:MSHA biogenesis protein MshO